MPTSDDIKPNAATVLASKFEAEDKMQQLLDERREHRKQEELVFGQLLQERAKAEVSLSKTARESLVLFQKKEALAQEALLTDFLVGGYGPLKTNLIESRPGLRPGTAELVYGGTIVAVRSSEVPLSPVFMVATSPAPEINELAEKLKRLAAQLMKAVVSVDTQSILSYRSRL